MSSFIYFFLPSSIFFFVYIEIIEEILIRACVYDPAHHLSLMHNVEELSSHFRALSGRTSMTSSGKLYDIYSPVVARLLGIEPIKAPDTSSYDDALTEIFYNLLCM